MFAIFRLGRYAMRASASRGPSGPPPQWQWAGGKGVMVLVLAILAVHWWHLVVFIVLPAMAVIVLAAVVAGIGKRHEARPDLLAEMLKHYDVNGRRKP